MVKWEVTIAAVQRVVSSGLTLVVLLLITQKPLLTFWHKSACFHNLFWDHFWCTFLRTFKNQIQV